MRCWRCRGHLDDARLLLLFRSRDLIHGDWPSALGRDDLVRDRRRVRFAAMDIPYGAVRGPLSRGRAPEPELDAMIDDAVVADFHCVTTWSDERDR